MNWTNDYSDRPYCYYCVIKFIVRDSLVVPGYWYGHVPSISIKFYALDGFAVMQKFPQQKHRRTSSLALGV